MTTATNINPESLPMNRIGRALQALGSTVRELNLLRITMDGRAHKLGEEIVRLDKAAPDDLSDQLDSLWDDLVSDLAFEADYIKPFIPRIEGIGIVIAENASRVMEGIKLEHPKLDLKRFYCDELKDLQSDLRELSSIIDNVGSFQSRVEGFGAGVSDEGDVAKDEMLSILKKLVACLNSCWFALRDVESELSRALART
jgi:hypothetical protein